MIKLIKDIILYAIWFPALVFVFNAVVWFLNVYETWPYIDIPMHFLGGIAITYFFWKTMFLTENRKLIPELPISIKLILAFSLTCTTTVFWEFAEYILDHTVAENVQLGLEDTLLDMLLGIIGGGVFLLMIAVKKGFMSNHRLEGNGMPSPQP